MRAAQWRSGYIGGMRMRMRADLQPERLQHAVAHEVHGQGVHALRLQKGSQQSRLCLVFVLNLCVCYVLTTKHTRARAHQRRASCGEKTAEQRHGTGARRFLSFSASWKEKHTRCCGAGLPRAWIKLLSSQSPASTQCLGSFNKNGGELV